MRGSKRGKESGGHQGSCHEELGEWSSCMLRSRSTFEGRQSFEYVRFEKSMGISNKDVKQAAGPSLYTYDIKGYIQGIPYERKSLGMSQTYVEPSLKACREHSLFQFLQHAKILIFSPQTFGHTVNHCLKCVTPLTPHLLSFVSLSLFLLLSLSFLLSTNWLLVVL